MSPFPFEKLYAKEEMSLTLLFVSLVGVEVRGGILVSNVLQLKEYSERALLVRLFLQLTKTR